MMTKKQVAAALEEIAVLLELCGENPFKSRSYSNAARVIEQMREDLDAVVREKRLREFKGIGEALEQKIEELVTTGKLTFLDELRARFPHGLFELFGIPNLGAKRVRAVYEGLKIDSIERLEESCKSGEITQLKGFSPKLQAKILEGIDFARKHQHQHLFHRAMDAAEEILAHLRGEPAVQRIELAGSLRRRKEIIKDIDVVASSKQPEAVMERFVTCPGVDSVVARGDTKSSIVWATGIAADLRVVEDKQFPFALAYFTGSKEHNVVMRQRAKERGLKLNEYGLLDGSGAETACRTEEDIYRALDLAYIPPELREDRGEFSVERLPELVEQQDLRGVLHCHTNYSDGQNSLREMAEAARALNYEYILVCDHSQSAGYAGGLKPDAVGRQFAEIDELNAAFEGFRILKGIESDIRTDGSLDYDTELLQRFELVVASIHSKLGMDEDEATRRIIKAIENPYTAILGHPTGRLLLARQGYTLDMEKVFDAAVANKVAIEINANTRRLDIDWRHIQRGKEKGVKFAIGPDAHSVTGLEDVRYGLGIARKGWLEAADVINCMSAGELLAWRK